MVGAGQWRNVSAACADRTVSGAHAGAGKVAHVDVVAVAAAAVVVVVILVLLKLMLCLLLLLVSLEGGGSSTLSKESKTWRKKS